jgi:hypothetical protein
MSEQQGCEGQQQRTNYRDYVSCGEPSRLSCKHVQEESSRLRENADSFQEAVNRYNLNNSVKSGTKKR